MTSYLERRRKVAAGHIKDARCARMAPCGKRSMAEKLADLKALGGLGVGERRGGGEREVQGESQRERCSAGHHGRSPG
jgi:hypothetical protein